MSSPGRIHFLVEPTTAYTTGQDESFINILLQPREGLAPLPKREMNNRKTVTRNITMRGFQFQMIARLDRFETLFAQRKGLALTVKRNQEAIEHIATN
jgi:hypothetical protein